MRFPPRTALGWAGLAGGVLFASYLFNAPPWTWIGPSLQGKAAPPQPQPAPSPLPGPNPAPPAPPAPLPTMQIVVISPGTSSLSLPAGSGFTLQLPPGASWPTLGPGSPVMQPPASVIGGTVNPLSPTGTESQVWTNVTGNGSLLIWYMDASGVLTASKIVVSTTGGGHALGA